jgi:hypothetical protein
MIGDHAMMYMSVVQGTEQEPEQAPDPAVDRRVRLVAEDPPEKKRDARPDAAGEEEEAAHVRESLRSAVPCQPASCASPG